MPSEQTAIPDSQDHRGCSGTYYLLSRRKLAAQGGGLPLRPQVKSFVHKKDTYIVMIKTVCVLAVCLLTAQYTDD